MAISSIFQDKIDLVDPSKTLIFTTDAVNYALNEWSHNGNLTITGYDDDALSHGAAALLYDKGFRFYAPHPDFHVLPASITTVAAQAKTQNFWPYNNPFIGQGHSRDVKFGGQAAQDELNGNFTAWKHLNACADTRNPITHAWPHIISNNTAFFSTRPQLLDTAPLSGGATFNLDDITPDGTPSDWDDLVKICASYCYAQLSALNRAAFDPTDGNGHNTVKVVRLTKAVVTQLRAGTPAIGPYPERPAVPTAQLGIYGYGKHADPSDVDFLSPGDGIYVSVATQFGPPAAVLVPKWGARADYVLLRDYWSVVAWDMAFPRGIKNVDFSTYANRYIGYEAQGALGANGETTAAWLKLLVNFYNIIQTARTGVADYEGRLQEIVDNIFDGDEAVATLYRSWNANATTARSKYILKPWMDIVASMTNSKKLMFQQYTAILGKFLLAEESGVKADFEDLLKMITHTDFVLQDIFHSYGFIRRLNKAPNWSAQWTDLYWSVMPAPSYYANARVPTVGDFEAVHAALEGFDRLPVLDNNDLVLVTMPDPPTGFVNNPDNRIPLMFPRPFVFVGPGTIHYLVGATEYTADYGPGFWRLSAIPGFPDAAGVAWADPGYLFVDAFKTVKLLNTGLYGDLFIYVPEGAEDAVAFDVHSRITIAWNGGSREVLSSGVQAQPFAMPAGWARIRMGSSRTFEAVTCFTALPYFSPYKNLAIMPRELAAQVHTPGISVYPPYAEPGDDDTLPVVFD